MINLTNTPWRNQYLIKQTWLWLGKQIVEALSQLLLKKIFIFKGMRGSAVVKNPVL